MVSRTSAEMNTESLNREDVRRPVGLIKAVSVALFLMKATSTDRGNLAPVAIPCKTYQNILTSKSWKCGYLGSGIVSGSVLFDNLV